MAKESKVQKVGRIGAKKQGRATCGKCVCGADIVFGKLHAVTGPSRKVKVCEGCGQLSLLEG